MHLISFISNNLTGAANQQTACIPLQNELPIALCVRLVMFVHSIERPYVEERIMSLEDLAKKAEEGFEKVVDAAKEKAEEAKDKLDELAGDAKDKAEDAKDKAAEAAEDAKDKAAEIAEDAKDKVEDVKDELEK